tara:strand:- start:249 stop:500 length:252 start_codon:yes stop_codon:yes gene_type:complete
MALIPAGANAEEARKNAMKASIANKDKYVTLYACFGVFMKISKTLHVNEPSDSFCDTYWFNGKEKSFTVKQKIADEKNTPTLN